MKLVTLTNGFSMMVDDEDAAGLSKDKWFAMQHHGNVYAARNTYDKSRGPLMRHRIRMVRAHRQIMGCTMFDGKIVDHIDGNGLNNQKSNLRIVDKFGNVRNSKPRNGRRFKGTCKQGTRWHASITAIKKDIYLGSFDTELQAAEAYNKAAQELHGVHARLNQL